MDLLRGKTWHRDDPAVQAGHTANCLSPVSWMRAAGGHTQAHSCGHERRWQWGACAVQPLGEMQRCCVKTGVGRRDDDEREGKVAARVIRRGCAAGQGGLG